MSLRRIYVAGHGGMVGRAICNQLAKDDSISIITAARSELDLTDQRAVMDFFSRGEFDEVYLAAAKVGGIHANNEYPAEFIYENLMIEVNIIHAAHMNGVNKLLFLGSSCIYPKLSEQPMFEEALLTGVLEKTNEPYAIAKIAGIKMCESYNRQFGRDYRSVMPTNLYGPNDNFHPENSHVIPALIRRIHEAKISGAASINAWGTGSPMREFLHVAEMASASIFVMNLDKKEYQKETTPMLSHINVGTGVDCTIKELTETVVAVIGYQGEIKWDSSKPNGSPRKLMDVSRLARLGWRAKTSLREGLTDTYLWFLENQAAIRS